MPADNQLGDHGDPWSHCFAEGIVSLVSPNYIWFQWFRYSADLQIYANGNKLIQNWNCPIFSQVVFFPYLSGDSIVTIYPKNEVPLWNYELLLQIWFAFVCIWVVLVCRLEFRVLPSTGSGLKCCSLWLLREYSRDLNAVTCRTFDQWEDKIALSCGLEELFLEKIIGAHQIEKLVKFFSFIYLQKIYIEIADYRGIFIFLLKCVNYGWHFLDKCFNIGIIIVIVRWSVNVADCNRPVKIVTRDINK